MLIFTFIVIYAPHTNYRYPFHIDEWRHITEATKLKSGEYDWGTSNSLEFGFHSFLMIMSYFTNLVLVYKYLPALFACLSSLALFFFVYRTTKRFYIGILSMLFFASLRNNVNITGLWFFIPLTFAIPLIYLFFMMFSCGIEEDNIIKLVYGLMIYVLIFFAHPISATFMIPILAVYLLIKKDFVKKHKALFVSFIVIFILFAAATFSKFLWKGTLSQSLSFFFEFIKFKEGWGVLELDISLMAVYNIVGLVFALVGVYFALRKKNYLFVIWPTMILVLISMFTVFKFTLFAPYQRLIYYLLLGLVPLGAIGFYYTLVLIKNTLIKLKWSKISVYSLMAILVIISTGVMFSNYYKLDKQVDLYRVIDDDDYKAIMFLDQYDQSNVLAMPHTSVAVYPISKHNIYATLYFYGNRKEIEGFFLSGNCSYMGNFIEEKEVDFVLNKGKIDCGWDMVYSQGPYIYNVSG
jgi:hypothetical protein